MMSKKQLACMLALHIIYLLLGASIFYHLESPVEMAQRAETKLERLEIQNLLYENYIPTDPEKQDSILKKLSEYCGKSMFNYTTDDEEPPIKWDFYHSFFFSYTVVSTIGYGNLSPTTHLSRILMMFYALFGIPINGILLANLGEYFGMQVIKVYRRYKRRDAKKADKVNYFFHNLGMLGQIFLYLVPGFLFFIFMPACIFMVFEGWDFVASIYYAFVTLTTIGFGDLVAGAINNGFASGYFVVYQLFLIIWITFGLGYIVMLLGFITSGMRSEGVHKIEQKLANQLKATQNRILSGFTRDVAIIRKIINEANLVKLKPVYIENAPYLYKSKSCPTLTFDIEPRDIVYRRKRANSENICLSTKDILRIQSDTDLLGIDREKTFSAAAIVRPAELLARVVNVLGGLEQQEEKGVHMFGDEEILASEKPHIWTIGQDSIMSPPRNRALSVDVPNYNVNSFNGDPAEKYKEAINQRAGKMSLPASMNTSLEENEPNQPQPPSPTIPKSILSKILRRPSAADGSEENLKNAVKSRVTIAPGQDRSTDSDDDILKAYREKTKKGRGSIFPKFDFAEDEDAAAIKAYTQKKRHSIFPTFDFSEDESASAAKAYREKTKTGRRSSIFPTFDFSESEDDLPKKYKESTKRGRRTSIFPTFNFDEKSDEEDDTIDEEELKRYQNKTKGGRLSLFPTFGKNKKKEEPTPQSSEEHDDDTIDEEELRRYQNKTKGGRLSLFPTFGKNKKKEEDPVPQSSEEHDDDTIDEEELKRYQSKTSKGRLSLFPTFGKNKKKEEDSLPQTSEDQEDDTIDEEELRRYQSKTKGGRLSLFPTFGKSKKQEQDAHPKPAEDDDDTIDEEELRRYQSKTKGGRLSLFPTFGKSKKQKEEDMPETSEELESYQNKTRKGRGSLFPSFGKDRKNSNEGLSDMEADIKRFQRARKPSLEPEEPEDVSLEQTSVADLLRALTVLDAVAPHEQRGSIDASLLGLLAAAAEPAKPPPARRRGSIRPDFVVPSLPPSLEEKIQKMHAEEQAGARRRRVSARAAAPSFTPSLATVVAGSELLTTAAAARENRMNIIENAPPSYSEATEEKNTEEEPQVPKTRRFSPAPLSVGRTSTAPVPRLFSRMRKESVNSIEEEEESESRRGSLTDIVIDNNKDNTDSKDNKDIT